MQCIMQNLDCFRGDFFDFNSSDVSSLLDLVVQAQRLSSFNLCLKEGKGEMDKTSLDQIAH